MICCNVPHSITMKDEFTTFDIEKILEIKRNCIQPWLDGGFVNPSIQRATRRGTKNLFSRDDLYKIRLFQLLLDSGISRKESGMYSNGLTFKNIGHGADDFKYALYVRHKINIERESGMWASSRLSKEAPKIVLGEHDVYAFVVNLVPIKDEVDRLLME